ncbi:PLP-dependent aminotransferase family protein [Sphingosinicella sp. BN140058]|uniref:aminotransferase-like domain-containing protein n=1 Tax=Sphingosinicella sp. BN140058 TaxID=1892855 RepID=UPI0010131802|nr:PLP-dependent aminotransferase family protein [Sphingosinicella sp. BN140058]QAY75753.1 PLP-dependent aminotransferase family protein [Sphingosinicella sp. BN140058]
MRWSPTLATSSGPIYRRIADAMAQDVADGRLAAGDRLPSQRELAQRLGVDLTTVTRAYAEAARRGLVDSDGRRGSFVRGPAAGASPPRAVASEAAGGMNMPPEPEGGLLREAIAAGIPHMIEQSVASLHYQTSGGSEDDRIAAARFLAKTIAGTSPDEVVVTAGAQNGLHAVCGILLGSGDRIAAGVFTYPGFVALARRFGATLVPLAMDEEGILPDALEREAKRAPLAALYVIPTNDNPTTATMGSARRQAIADIARRFGIRIIEDDPYGRLPENPLSPIAALVPELTWHVTSVSKILSPCLRVGFVRAPDLRSAARLAGDIHETAIMPPPLNLALVKHWLADGTFARLVRGVRAEAETRSRAAIASLSGVDVRHRPEGYHLWLKLDARLAAADITAQAAGFSLPVAPSSSFCFNGEAPYQALRLSLGGARSRDAVVREARRLDALLAQAVRRGHVVV